MIVPSEINENDIVKLLVNEDGIEDEMYGVVGMNTGLDPRGEISQPY
jgi:hypothetical protein